MLPREYATTAEEYRKLYDNESGPLPLFPPPTIDAPGAGYKNGLSSTWATPFITPSAGGLPHGPPCCVDELCANYLVGGLSKNPPNIDIDFETACCATNNEAKRTLAKADAGGSIWWAAVHVPTIQHPVWWPRQAVPVPGFEHVIVGAHAAGIGMHRDRYTQPTEASGPAGGQAPATGERLVSTYLALGRGRKHVVLLPPTEEGARVADTLGGLGCDSAYGRQSSQRVRFPLRPPPEMLEAVLAAGGYWFPIEAKRGDDGEDEDEEEEEEEEEVEGVEEEEERGEDKAAEPELILVEPPVAASEETGPPASATRAYGSNVGSSASSSGEDEDEDDDDDEEEEEEEVEPVCVFLPAGWYHWLVGDSDFHVAWSGSFFPGTQSRAAGGKGGGRHGGTGGGSASGRGGRSKQQQQQQQQQGNQPQRGSRAPRWARGF